MSVNLASCVSSIEAKFEALKLASDRLSRGDKRSAVESRALALELQRLCGDYRKGALLAGKDIKVVPKRKAKAPQVEESKGPAMIHMLLPSGEVKSIEFPRLSDPEPAKEPIAPLGPIAEEVKVAAPQQSAQEPPKVEKKPEECKPSEPDGVPEPAPKPAKPTELSEIAAVKPRPRGRK